MLKYKNKIKRLAFVFLAIIMLTSCASRKAKTDGGKVLVQFLEDYKNYDEEKLNKLFTENNNIFKKRDLNKDIETTKEFTKKLSYKILEENEESDKTTVKLETKFIDAKKAMEEVLKEANLSSETEESLRQKAKKAFDNEQNQITKNVVVILDKDGDTYKINFDKNKDLEGVLTGGLEEL